MTLCRGEMDGCRPEGMHSDRWAPLLTNVFSQWTRSIKRRSELFAQKLCFYCMHNKVNNKPQQRLQKFKWNLLVCLHQFFPFLSVRFVCCDSNNANV